MRKTLIAATLLAMCVGTVADAGNVRKDYADDEKLAIMQGVGGVGVLSHCETNDLYTSEVGRPAYAKITFIFETIGNPELTARAVSLFRSARGTGVYPMVVHDSDGKTKVEPFPVTDEAGCKMVEEKVKALMAPGGLFDVSTVPSQGASQ